MLHSGAKLHLEQAYCLSLTIFGNVCIQAKQKPFFLYIIGPTAIGSSRIITSPGATFLAVTRYLVNKKYSLQ